MKEQLACLQGFLPTLQQMHESIGLIFLKVNELGLQEFALVLQLGSYMGKDPFVYRILLLLVPNLFGKLFGEHVHKHYS